MSQLRLFLSSLLLFLVLGLLMAIPAGAIAVIPIVTTTTDLQSLVEVVGGDRVRVTSIALPAQDPHTFEPRLANLQQLRQAQLVVKVGLDHDLWIDSLLREVNRPELQRNGSGYVDASIGIPLLEVRSTALAPPTGHTHGAGNPHYWLDPLNAEPITGAILDGLARIDPDHARVYENNRATFLAELKTKVTAWEQQLAPYQGVPLIAYHNSWPYLARRFRLNVIDYIELKPGVPPSPTHLSHLIRQIKTARVPVLLKEPYEADQIPRLLHQKTGVAIATLLPSVGARPDIQTYFDLFDYNVQTLAQALVSSPRPPS